MNIYAYLATGQLIALMESISKVRVRVHARDNIPADTSIIFVINHFTRIETLLLPYHIYQITGVPVWSMADAGLFTGTFGYLLETVGAISTQAPDRDRLIVKTLLTGEGNWIIFPEGCMVKDKALVEPPHHFFPHTEGRRPPHTGAATLALRTGFYRNRLRKLAAENPAEAERLQSMFGIKDLCPVFSGSTRIVPVNITYYPLRARENILSRMAERFFNHIPASLHEELLLEGAMLMEGVDIDIRIGKPLKIGRHLDNNIIQQDIASTDQINFDDILPSRSTMRREAFNLMCRYMESIYEMTTVNHDHLFASIIRNLPARRISGDDLRRRVFLLAQKLGPLGINLHNSLSYGQTALLTDDRFNKYQEFLTLSLETGVIKQDGDMLVIDSKKFAYSREFHRARIDNPVGVMANEVHPLFELQNEARFIAWLPVRVVRYLASRHLLDEAANEFEADYRRFFKEGESKDRAVGKPILIRGSSRELGVVLVHGFLAAPSELSELAGYLAKTGCWVYVVRLKGHGTSSDDLALRCAEDWRESVENAYAAIKNICKQVIVGGFSLGGALALDCAARMPEIKGVFAVCPPMELQDISALFAPTVAAWNRLMEMIHFQEGKMEFVLSTSEHPEINYTRVPVSGVAELSHFMKSLESRLEEINMPALVVQAERDPIVEPEASQRLFDRIGSRQKEYRSLDFDRHGILSGKGSEEVFAVISTFMNNVTLENRK
jgi:esterase/lipase/1-acyl-sn-glycerol-3-phosphate acyltransferase